MRGMPPGPGWPPGGGSGTSWSRRSISVSGGTAPGAPSSARPIRSWWMQSGAGTPSWCRSWLRSPPRRWRKRATSGLFTIRASRWCTRGSRHRRARRRSTRGSPSRTWPSCSRCVASRRRRSPPCSPGSRRSGAGTPARPAACRSRCSRSSGRGASGSSRCGACPRCREWPTRRAAGLPLALLEEIRPGSKRFLKVRGLTALPGVARAVAVDGLELGFVDILSYDGTLDHPLSGPREELYWRRTVVQNSEPPRSPAPVVEQGITASIGAVFQIKPRRQTPDAAAVQQVLKTIGLGPNGRHWDCRACGYGTCREFAEAAALCQASLKQCTPYQERRAEESQREAATDLLTGLATFRVLRDRLTHEVERSKRSGERFTVLFLDLDRLKEINDLHGHEAGNEVLRAVAQEIRAAVRASDLAARYGGDEFVIILTRTERNGAERVAEVLRQGIEAAGRRLGYPPGAVTVSAGISEFDPAHATSGDLLVSADRALYKAKAAGRNTVV